MKLKKKQHKTNLKWEFTRLGGGIGGGTPFTSDV